MSTHKCHNETELRTYIADNIFRHGYLIHDANKRAWLAWENLDDTMCLRPWDGDEVPHTRTTFCYSAAEFLPYPVWVTTPDPAGNA